MKPYYDEDSVTVWNTDCRALPIPDASVQTCITSPPYFWLRDYNVEGQIGLEPTMDEYIASIVTVFREVRRVLRDDGTLWLNIGDSYSDDTKWGATSGGKNYTSAAGGYQGQRVRRGTDCDPKRGDAAPGQPMQQGNSGLKPKDLCGIPWRVAFALQADGWYLRSDIIWHKPNPMPESVTDRPTKSHEYLFLLSKSQRYYYSAEAIAQDSVQPGRAGKLEKSFSTSDPLSTLRQDVGRCVMRTDTRNARTVWTIPTQGYPGAHFATFPQKLVEPCIKAGSRPGDTVLDPFAGSGTVAEVARRFGRKFVGTELSAEYCGLIADRLRQRTLFGAGATT